MMSRLHWSHGKGETDLLYKTLCNFLVPMIAESHEQITCKLCKSKLFEVRIAPVENPTEEPFYPYCKVYDHAACSEALVIEQTHKARFRDLASALRWYVDVAILNAAPSASWSFNVLGTVNLEVSSTGAILSRAEVRRRIADMRDKPWPFSKTNAVPTVGNLERCSDYKVEIEKALIFAFLSEESRHGLKRWECVDILLERVAGLPIAGKDQRQRESAEALAAHYNVSESIIGSIVKHAKRRMNAELQRKQLIEADDEQTMANHRASVEDNWL